MNLIHDYIIKTGLDTKIAVLILWSVYKIKQYGVVLKIVSSKHSLLVTCYRIRTIDVLGFDYAACSTPEVIIYVYKIYLTMNSQCL